MKPCKFFRPFGVDRDGVLPVGHSAAEEKLELNENSTNVSHLQAQVSTSIQNTSPNKLYTFASPQTHWKV